MTRPNPPSEESARIRGNAQINDSDPYGDRLRRLTDSDRVLRVMFLNVGGIPATSGQKLSSIKTVIAKTQVDVAALAEINTNWNRVDASRSLYEQLFGWQFARPRVINGFYSRSPVPGNFVRGGTSVWTMGTARDRSSTMGTDESGLGRWSWTRLAGREGITIRIISCYRPTYNPRYPGSTWSQQRAYFDDNNIDRDPREQFFRDLFRELATWTAAGDQIVLGIDLNEDVRKPFIRERFARAGLIELLTSTHDECVPTSNTGSAPIDGIYVSRLLRGCSCGWLPFGSFDHRPLWIDIPYGLAYGYSAEDSAMPKYRRLRLDDPRTVKKYHQILTKKLAEANLPQRSSDLWDSCEEGVPLTQRQARAFDRINAEYLKAVVFADRHCRKIRQGTVDYSPAYSRIRHRILYWQRMARQLRRRSRPNARYMKRLAKRAGIVYDPVICGSLPLVKAKLKEAYADNARFKRYGKKKARQEREDHITRLAKAKAACGKFTAEHHIKVMRARELQRTDARIIRRANRKLRNGSVSQVIGPPFLPDGTADITGDWITYSSKADIERACLWENCRRFNQASTTPPMTPPLFAALGRMGTGPLVDSILRGEGDFRLPGVDPWARKLLKHFQYLPAVQEGARVSLAIPSEKYRSAWTKVRETTAPGPSGFTCAQMKAHLLPGGEEAMEIDRILLSIPYTTGYSPSLWQLGTNCELEKKSGSIRVDLLRAILLYEIQFNMGNKILGRDSMYFTEDLRGIAGEQYGSRKQHSSINQCLNKRLTFDLLRQRRQAGALCSNDAKSCYDRITHSIASLALQRVGVPTPPLICMFTTIQMMEHRIRTVFGDSEIGFSGKLWAVPIQGVGQGNGAGPQIWALVSTPVLNMLREEGFGAAFEASISGDRIHFVGYAFVDDTDLITTLSLDATCAEVGLAMQRALDAWEGGIRATGGAIVPTKSFWYLVDFKWQRGEWSYKSIDSTPGELTVLDLDGRRCTLRRLAAHEADKTLGVYLAPDGNNDAQVKYLRTKAVTWAESIRVGMLPKRLAWQSLTTTILRTLLYPLPATTFSLSECRHILAPVKAAGLNGLGIVRSMTLPVALGPASHQGLGLPDLYVHQGIEHIIRICGLSHCLEDFTGRLLRQSMEALALEVGCSGSPFDQPYAAWKNLVTPTWLTNTWEFLDGQTWKLTWHHATLSLRASGDSFLMELVSHLPLKQRLGFQRCRLFKRLLTVADVVHGDGSTLDRQVFSRQRSTGWAANRYVWPNQGRPQASDWDIWESTILGLFDRHDHLLAPLTEWSATATAPSCWRFSPSEEALYDVSQSPVKRMQRLPRRHTRNAKLRFRDQGTVGLLPPDAQPATVYKSRSILVFSGSLPVESTPPQRAPTFRDHLSQRPIGCQWALRQLSLGNLSNLLRAIRAGEAVLAISDGSYKDNLGTAAWFIRAEGRPTTTVSGRCHIPGRPTDHSAYRSELGGLYGALCFLQSLEDYFALRIPKVRLGCDGDSPMEQAFQLGERLTPDMNHYDLIGACRKLMTMLSSRPIITYVKGHADETKDDDDLTEPEFLNKLCDLAAGEYLDVIARTDAPEPCSDIWMGPATMSVDGHTIIRAFRPSLIIASSGRTLVNYWLSKGRFPHGHAGQIAWEAQGLAAKGAGTTRHQWLVKMVSGRGPVGIEMFMRKKWPNPGCPCCPEPFETFSHVLTCPSGIGVWATGLSGLRKWLSTTTSPWIARCITQRLEEWRSGQPIEPWQSSLPSVRTAVTAQDSLGWENMLTGIVSEHWAEAQAHYLSSLRSKKSPRRWLASLIQKQWDICWDLWNYRNRILHDKETGRAQRDIRRQLRVLHALPRTDFPSTCHHFFSLTLQDLYKSPERTQVAWISRLNSAMGRMARKKRNAARRQASQRALMRRRFLLRRFPAN